MDIFDKAVLMARTARVMVRLEGMKVENMERRTRGLALAYSENQFQAMLEEEGLAEPVKDITPAEKADHAKVIARLEDVVRDIISAVGNGENDVAENDEIVRHGVEDIFKAFTEVKS